MTLENGTYEGLFFTFLLPDWTDVLILPIAFYRKAVGAGAAAKVAKEFVRRTTARITLHPTALAKVCVTDLAATAVAAEMGLDAADCIMHQLGKPIESSLGLLVITKAKVAQNSFQDGVDMVYVENFICFDAHSLSSWRDGPHRCCLPLL